MKATVRSQITVIGGIQQRCHVCHGHAGWFISSRGRGLVSCPGHIGDSVRLLLEPSLAVFSETHYVWKTGRDGRVSVHASITRKSQARNADTDAADEGD